MESISETPSTTKSTRDSARGTHSFRPAARLSQTESNMTTHNVSNSSRGSASGAPSSLDVRQLMKRKSENELKLETISNRIKRLQCQEEKVWKEVTSSQKSSVRSQEAQNRRQIKQFEKCQIEQVNTQERHSRCSSAIQQRVSLQASRERCRQKLLDTQNQGIQVRLEESERRASIEEFRRKEFEKKQQLVGQVKIQKQKAQNSINLYNAKRIWEHSRCKMDDYFMLQEQLSQLEIDVSVAEEQESRTLEKLRHSQNWRREMMADFRSTPQEPEKQQEQQVAQQSPGPESYTIHSPKNGQSPNGRNTNDTTELPSHQQPLQMGLRNVKTKPTSTWGTVKTLGGNKIERWATMSNVGKLGQIVEEDLS